MKLGGEGRRGLISPLLPHGLVKENDTRQDAGQPDDEEVVLGVRGRYEEGNGEQHCAKGKCHQADGLAAPGKNRADFS